MISCQEAKEFISLKLDSEITEYEDQLLKEHLSQCSSCQAYSDKMNELHQRLFTLPDLNTGGSIVDELIHSGQIKVKNKPLRTRRFKPWYGVVAAALIIGMILPFGLLNQSKDDAIGQTASSPNDARSLAKIETTKGDEVTIAKSKDGEIDAGRYGIAADTIEKTPLGNNNNQSENADKSLLKDSNQVELTMDSSHSIVLDGASYTVQELDRQLVIFKDGKEVYRSNQWKKSEYVKWEKTNETTITYYLYGSDEKLMSKNEIDLNEIK